MIPIHEMVETEWNNLSYAEQAEYGFGLFGLSNVHRWDFYIKMLSYHIKHGGKIRKKIWDSLKPHQREQILGSATIFPEEIVHEDYLEYLDELKKKT